MTRRRCLVLSLLVLFPLVVSCTAPTLTGNLPERQLFTEGLAYEALSNYSAALNRYQQVLENFGENSLWSQRARLRSARIYKNHLNRPERAIEYYKNYLARHDSADPTKASVLMELARVYRDEGKTSRAVETYRTVVNNYSSISQVEESYYNLGEIHLDQENYSKAIEAFSRLLEEFPEGDLRDGALFQLAKAYEGLGRPQDQLETYQRLLENYPDSDLHEYTVFLTVKLAVDQDRKEIAQKWANYYSNTYNEGQYSDRIENLIE